MELNKSQTDLDSYESKFSVPAGYRISLQKDNTVFNITLSLTRNGCSWFVWREEELKKIESITDSLTKFVVTSQTSRSFPYNNSVATLIYLPTQDANSSLLCDGIGTIDSLYKVDQQALEGVQTLPFVMTNDMRAVYSVSINSPVVTSNQDGSDISYDYSTTIKEGNKYQTEIDEIIKSITLK